MEISFPELPEEEADLYYVQLFSTDVNRPFALVTTRNFPVVVTGLAAGTSYNVSVRSHNASAPSIAFGPAWLPPSTAVECTTAPEVAVDTDNTSTPFTAESSVTGGGSGGLFMRVYQCPGMLSTSTSWRITTQQAWTQCLFIS